MNSNDSVRLLGGVDGRSLDSADLALLSGRLINWRAGASAVGTGVGDPGTDGVHADVVVGRGGDVAAERAHEAQDAVVGCLVDELPRGFFEPGYGGHEGD